MLIMRDVSSIAGRKQLKHRSRLYDLLRTDIEIDINDYNPIWIYNLLVKNHRFLLIMLPSNE